MTPWVERPTIDLDLAEAPGLRYARIADDVRADGRRLLEAVARDLPASARLLADIVRVRTANRFQREATALAALVGAGWREVLLANVSYDLLLASFGCSTVALPTRSGPLLARNMDWWPEDLLAGASYLFRFFRNGRLGYANAGWPGAIGVVTGLSGRGFALALNAVSYFDGLDKLGYPVLLHLRRVLEDAEDFDAALKTLSEQRLAAPALITLVGTRNEQRVVIERSPLRCAQRWGQPGKPLLATNHYRDLFAQGDSSGNMLYENTCERFDALCHLLADHDPNAEASDAFLLYILSDPSVLQTITAQQIVIRPYAGRIRLFVPRRLLEPDDAES